MNINYIRVGDYYIPDLTLPEETRPIGKWGRMHREYLREHKPIQYNCLFLSGKLWSYLADLNEQAQDRLERMIDQIKADFAELYRTLNGTPLQEMDWIINPVCALCRDHERNGFVHGVQVGVRLAQEIQNVESSIYAMPQPGEMALRLLLLLERRHFLRNHLNRVGFVAVILHEKYFSKLYRLRKNEIITANTMLLLLIRLTK